MHDDRPGAHPRSGPPPRSVRRGWFIGASISLIWTFPVLVELWEGPSVAGHLVGTGIVVAFAAVFMATVPYARVTTSRLHRLLPTVVLFALSLALLPWLGTDIRWMWTFVGVAFAVSAMGRRITCSSSPPSAPCRSSSARRWGPTRSRTS